MLAQLQRSAFLDKELDMIVIRFISFHSLYPLSLASDSRRYSDVPSSVLNGASAKKYFSQNYAYIPGRFHFPSILYFTTIIVLCDL